METIEFNEMGLSKDLLHMIKEKGFLTPTPIQIMSIPLMLAGRDVMGQAQTGTGKTASFGLPILSKVKPKQGLQALVLCPTRELALQVRDEIAFLGRRLRISIMAIYGGQSIEAQFRGLEKRPEVVVATPGRMLDHLGRKTIDLSKLSFVVLDEADEMLDMGFLADIEKILQECPQDRQTALFSATLGEGIQQLGRRFMDNPQKVIIEAPERTVAEINHCYFEVNPRYKLETLCRIIDTKQPSSCLVFCRTKRSVGQLANYLEKCGYSADALHGDMSQRDRDQVMRRFRSGNIGILVATDLAARGLDIALVSHVINFDIPEDPDVFIHRTGRTGRAGRVGEAVTLVETLQYRQFRIIERHIGRRIKKEVLNTGNENEKGRNEFLQNRILQAMQKPAKNYEAMAEKMIAEHNPITIIASFLRLLDEQLPEREEDFSAIKQRKSTKGKDNAKYNRVNEISTDESVHLELPVGRIHGFDAQRIAEYIVSHSTLTPQQIGDIEVNKSSAYVEVTLDKVDEVYSVMHNFDRPRRPARKKTASQGYRFNNSKA